MNRRIGPPTTSILVLRSTTNTLCGSGREALQPIIIPPITRTRCRDQTEACYRRHLYVSLPSHLHCLRYLEQVTIVMADQSDDDISMASSDYGQSQRQTSHTMTRNDAGSMIIDTLTGRWSSHPQFACVFMAAFVLAPALLVIFAGLVKYISLLRWRGIDLIECSVYRRWRTKRKTSRNIRDTECGHSLFPREKALVD